MSSVAAYGLDQALSEGRSLLASLITQLIGIVRQCIAIVHETTQRVLRYISKDPLAAILLIGNVVIWVS